MSFTGKSYSQIQTVTSRTVEDSKNDAVTSRTVVEDSKNNAVTSRTVVEDSKNNAVTSRTVVEDSKNNAATSRTVVEDSKKKTSLLKDNSWIKRNVDEDKPVDQDANFGKSVLGRYKSNENLDSSAGTSSKTENKTTTVTTSGSSVQALTKRFGGSQDKLNETRTTTTRSTVRTQPKNSTSTTTTVKDGIKVTETVTTTRKDVVKSSTKSETNPSDMKPTSSGEYKSEVTTVKSKDIIDGPTSTVKTATSTKTYTKEDVSPIKTTSYALKSTKSTEDQLCDTLIPTSVKTTNTKPNSSDYKSEVITVKSSTDTAVGPTSSVKTTTSVKTFTTEDTPSSAKTTSYSVQSPKSQFKTEVTTVKSPTDTIDSIKTYTRGNVSPTKTTSYTLQSTKSTDDQLFDTLLPTSIKTNSNSSREDQDITVSKSIRTVHSSNDRHEWGSVTSPSYTTRTSYTETRPIDYLSDTITSKSSTTVYTSPERKVSEKDLCTFCRKNMYNDEKIILDDMNINCHASCFKCDVCNTSLGHLKAGDSLWVYRSAVHCESCFAVTKGKWHR